MLTHSLLDIDKEGIYICTVHRACAVRLHDASPKDGKDEEMKRSEINDAIRQAKNLTKKLNFKLPEFGHWDGEEWRSRKESISTIRQTMCGWDITDFGSNNFKTTGAVLFTIRNGVEGDESIGTPYAEKVIILLHENAQQIPYHYHLKKTEDIINRGGGILALELYNSTPEGEVDRHNDVHVYMDGVRRCLKPGELVEVTPGNSITITPGMYHRFWAKQGEGDLLVGEVSSINDDATDNYFLHGAARFAEIEEDEPAIHPLVNEYDRM